MAEKIELNIGDTVLIEGTTKIGKIVGFDGNRYKVSIEDRDIILLEDYKLTKRQMLFE